MDTEQYNYHGYVVEAATRLDFARAKAEAQKLLDKQYGQAWELEGAIPGSIRLPERFEDAIDGLILIFRRRKEHPVTGVSVGGT